MPEQSVRPWQPFEETPHTLHLEGIHDDYEGLRFLLRESDPTAPMLRLTFDYPIGYRSADESYRLRLWASLSEMDSIPTLLLVDHSEWVRWLVDEASGVLSEEALTHYAIYTSNDCVDIASQVPPRAEILGL